jgi:hypothetical protein
VASTPNTASVIAITMLQVRRERAGADGMGALSHRIGAASRVRDRFAAARLCDTAPIGSCTPSEVVR